MKYKVIIGLEVHIELSTQSKMFCDCSAKYFGQEPNIHTCPVCLGLPGALPVPNKKAIEFCRKIGLALDCKILNFSKFDRKNYFYPDLPKGYQISQYDVPFCENGIIKIGKENKKIRIKRVHMEEDTGKLIHQDKNTLIDFNRSGVPLVEVVTEPDLASAYEVSQYLKDLQQIVRYLNVSDANMEKGEMRLEPNISLCSNDDKKLPKYKVEIKNINSFKFVEKAINFEIQRQMNALENGNIPIQETRGWNEAKQITFSQRAKEEAHDYRYFPEPDIPPLTITNDQIGILKKSLPELPKEKLNRFMKNYAINYSDAEILTRNIDLASLYEKTVSFKKNENISFNKIAKYIINKKPDLKKANPLQLFYDIEKSIEYVGIDNDTLSKAIDEVIKKHPNAIRDLKNGKQQVIMFLIGQVLKTLGKKADTKILKEKLIERIN